MPSWYLKAAIQGALSQLPQSYRWNYFFQRYVSKGLRLTDDYFEGKLSICRQHLANFRQFRQSEPVHILELGTGWLPIVPVGLALSGQADILTIDLTPLLRKEIVGETLSHFVKYANDGRLAAHLPDLHNDRVATLRRVQENFASYSAREALEQLHIKSIVADARHIQPDDIDLMVSNNTLEHIPGDTIEAIFTNLRSALAPNGLMSHLIDLSDHYSHFDGQITPYNFLQYPSSRWRFFNNELHYQNRLRVTDYRMIHERADYQILREENHAAAPDALEDISPASEFADYPPEELSITRSWMISSPN